MEYLYAPWRGTYSKQAQNQKHQKNGCPFCNQIARNDDEKYCILKRLKHCTIILNLYPYNPGHILIVPNQHAARLDELTTAAQTEIMQTITDCVKKIEQTLKNSGTNVGINLGDQASGGSIPEHLHVHVLPRWKGDTNFLPILAQTKQLSEDLRVIYDRLRKVFE